MNSTRFTLLPVGARFEYEGKWYVKSTPLIAAASDGSGQRMIPRSAMVNVEGQAPAPERKAPASVDSKAVVEALTEYHAEALAAAVDDSARERLQAAKQRLLERLNLH